MQSLTLVLAAAALGLAFAASERVGMTDSSPHQHGHHHSAEWKVAAAQ
ncbi:hypothetical protein [Acetobacter estunensis]|nr:hypothetical protein [Acetobacter estunensis]MBV1837520.1 hypothetical protein [Acetobacter estunensis]